MSHNFTIFIKLYLVVATSLYDIAYQRRAMPCTEWDNEMCYRRSSLSTVSWGHIKVTEGESPLSGQFQPII